MILAIAAIGWKYQQYLQNPWTRDGQIRAQVIQVTPRVTGPIINLAIHDNSEVKAGDLLFEIDPRTYQAALAKAHASLAQSQALLKKAQDEAKRGHSLSRRQPGSISQLSLSQLNNAVDSPSWRHGRQGCFRRSRTQPQFYRSYRAGRRIYYQSYVENG